eukprot:261701-Rhodomonas_salina.1
MDAGRSVLYILQQSGALHMVADPGRGSRSTELRPLPPHSLMSPGQGIAGTVVTAAGRLWRWRGSCFTVDGSFAE